MVVFRFFKESKKLFVSTMDTLLFLRNFFCCFLSNNSLLRQNIQEQSIVDGVLLVRAVSRLLMRPAVARDMTFGVVLRDEDETEETGGGGNFI